MVEGKIDARCPDCWAGGGLHLRGCKLEGVYMNTVDKILKERGRAYGDVEVQAAKFEDLLEAMGQLQDPRLNPVQKQSLRMIALKVSRILTGGGDQDTWRDIEGYAKLAADQFLSKGGYPRGEEDGN